MTLRPESGRRRPNEVLKEKGPSSFKIAKTTANSNVRSHHAADAVTTAGERAHSIMRQANGNGFSTEDPSRFRKSATHTLPYGNTNVGRVGQGYIAGMSSGPPSHAGIVDARLDIHGEDGRIYQAPSFFNQNENLRDLQIGQSVSFKSYIDNQGCWAFDVTLLRRPSSER